MPSIPNGPELIPDQLGHFFTQEQLDEMFDPAFEEDFQDVGDKVYHSLGEEDGDEADDADFDDDFA